MSDIKSRFDSVFTDGKHKPEEGVLIFIYQLTSMTLYLLIISYSQFWLIFIVKIKRKKHNVTKIMNNCHYLVFLQRNFTVGVFQPKIRKASPH